MRILGCICAILSAGSCILGISAVEQDETTSNAEQITVFITGNELGKMKPCGCSEGQLGGLEKRAAILKSVPASRRLIIDTGRVVEDRGDQSQIKFEIIFEAFRRLGYDLVNLTEEDIEVARDLALLENISDTLKLISCRQLSDANIPQKYSRRFLLSNEALTLTVAAFDPERAPIEQVRELFAARPDSRTFNILIANCCDSASIKLIAETGLVDCLICPPEGDKPQIVGDPNRRPLVISAPRFGKYVGKLRISLDKHTADAKLRFSSVAVNERFRDETALVELYKDYQQLVRMANLLENHPRFPLANGLEYVGSKSCRPCHSYEYDKWSTKAHASAYKTLEDDGSEYDPECVVCHVVGLDYESGFITKDKTPDLKDVGCENCHGPGSRHLESTDPADLGQPKAPCIQCHTPENSANYAGNEQLYFQKIIHWPEPNAAPDVEY